MTTDTTLIADSTPSDRKPGSPRGNSKRSSVTLKDVAQRANVSPTTASLFFNGREDVCAKSTAARLRQAAADLQYPTNLGRRRGREHRVPAAAANHALGAANTSSESFELLSHASTATAHVGPGYTVGVGIPQHAAPITDSQSDPATSDYPEGSLEKVWRGISHVADIEGYRILQYPRRTRDGDSIQPFLSGSGINGVLLMARVNDPRPSLLAAAGLPVVVVGRVDDIPEGCGAVFALESDTVDLAMSHLWHLGHRRIAHCTQATIGGTGVRDEASRRRLDRYSAWTQIRSIYDPNLIFFGHRAEDPEADAADVLTRLMSMPDPPTAIFCADDSVAIAVCRAAAQIGFSVPEDLSIVGVDNSSDGAGNKPSISSVEIPYEQIGVQAVVQLTRLLEGASAASCRAAVAVTRLVARESTGPPVQAGNISSS